jgi:hypothetical protein
VLIPPANGEPLAQPGAGHLPAQLGPETTAGFASAAGHRALDVAQLGLHVRLERAGNGRSELHRGRWQSDLDVSVVLDRSMMTSLDLRSARRLHRSLIGAINVVT